METLFLVIGDNDENKFANNYYTKLQKTNYLQITTLTKNTCDFFFHASIYRCLEKEQTLLHKDWYLYRVLTNSVSKLPRCSITANYDIFYHPLFSDKYTTTDIGEKGHRGY